MLSKSVNLKIKNRKKNVLMIKKAKVKESVTAVLLAVAVIKTRNMSQKVKLR